MLGLIIPSIVWYYKHTKDNTMKTRYFTIKKNKKNILSKLQLHALWYRNTERGKESTIIL